MVDRLKIQCYCINQQGQTARRKIKLIDRSHTELVGALAAETGQRAGRVGTGSLSRLFFYLILQDNELT